MYPGKVRMCDIFEPHDVLVPRNFYSKKKSERDNELQQSTGPTALVHSRNIITWIGNEIPYHSKTRFFKKFIIKAVKQAAKRFFRKDFYGTNR